MVTTSDMVLESEIAYRRERIARDFAASRRQKRAARRRKHHEPVPEQRRSDDLGL